MLYDTVVEECQLSHRVPPSSSATDLSAMHSLYELVFDTCCQSAGPGGAPSPYRPLLQVIMAAQEPLPHTLLHEMGLACLLKALPGWGCLFYEAEHHIFMSHKSLSNWLLVGKQTNPRHSMHDAVSQGHAKLAAHLMRPILGPQPAAASRPPPLPPLSIYASQYVFLHLCQAHAQSSSPLLDAALAHWELLKVLIKAGHGGRIVKALGNMEVRSPYADESYRWLRRCLNFFEEEPDMMEMVTYAQCPIKSLKYAEALSRLPHAVSAYQQFGGHADWSSLSSVLSVTLEGHSREIHSIVFSPEGERLATASGDRTTKTPEGLAAELIAVTGLV
eukprot:gene28726-31902_t